MRTRGRGYQREREGESLPELYGGIPAGSRNWIKQTLLGTVWAPGISVRGKKGRGLRSGSLFLPLSHFILEGSKKKKGKTKGPGSNEF